MVSGPIHEMMRFPLRSIFVAAALALGQTAPAFAQDLDSAPLEVLYGFTLIDGRGGPPIEDAAMAISG